MKKISSILFAVLGTVMVCAALWICIGMRDAAPKLLGSTEDAYQCTRAMFDRICAGDYAGASQYLYGNPQLGTKGDRETAVGQQIWDAFAASLEYTMDGECYATASGISQDVTIRGLQIPSITASLKQHAAAALEQQVNTAVDMKEVYNEDYSYRQEFLDGVLRDAAAEAIAAGTIGEQSLTVHLVYDKDQWYVVPDQALLDAVSGGILE